MAANGELRLAWTPSPGEFVFNIAPLGLMLELEAACNAGAIEIADRIRSRTWRIRDVRETIRLALIGGGMKEADALELVKRHVDIPPADGQQSNALLAQAILMAWVVGVPGDNDVGKKAEPDRTATEPPASGLFDPNSTELAQSSDTRRETSTP